MSDDKIKEDKKDDTDTVTKKDTKDLMRICDKVTCCDKFENWKKHKKTRERIDLGL